MSAQPGSIIDKSEWMSLLMQLSLHCFWQSGHQYLSAQPATIVNITLSSTLLMWQFTYFNHQKPEGKPGVREKNCKYMLIGCCFQHCLCPITCSQCTSFHWVAVTEQFLFLQLALHFRITFLTETDTSIHWKKLFSNKLINTLPALSRCNRAVLVLAVGAAFGITLLTNTNAPIQKLLF